MLIASLQRWDGGAMRPSAVRLAEGLSVSLRNHQPGSGDLRPWAGAAVVYALGGGATQRKSLYRMGTSLASDTQYWLSWTSDVDVARSLLALDETDRIYYTGDGSPKVADNLTALSSNPYPSGSRTLGVPMPDKPSSATVIDAGIAEDVETRAYLITFVNEYEEEGPPSLPVRVACKTDATVRLNGVPGTPGATWLVAKVRLYVSTGGDFIRCGEMSVGPSTMDDTLTQRTSVLETGGDLSRPAWLPPPSGLRGMIGLWGGMIGAFIGKSARVCHPYKPHAWPIEYEVLLHHDIVATAKFGTTWVLLTNGPPAIVTGNTPMAMSDEPVDLMEPCVSKRSAVGVGHGVCWASNRGLCYVGTQGGPRILTEGILTPKQWQDNYNPTTIIGTRVERWYLGSYASGSTRKAFLLDTTGQGGIIDLDVGAGYGFFRDPLTDRLYWIDDQNRVARWELGAPLEVTDVSREVRTPRPAEAAFVQVVAENYPVEVSIATIGPDGRSTEVRQVVDGEPHSLAGGCRGDRFQITTRSSFPVQLVMVAENLADFP